MMLLGWVNVIALVLLACRLMARWPVPGMEKPLLGAVILWVTLIMTGHTLSLFGMLGNGWLYCGVSVAWLWGLAALLGKITPFAPGAVPLCAAPGLHFHMFENPLTERRVYWLMLGLLGAAAFCSLVLVLNNNAGNADSISYRLPRAFWYVSHGSLLHPFDTIDRRTIFYPLNGTLLYVPLVVYGFPATFHNLPTYIGWAAAGLTCYRFVRELGGGKAISAMATALAMLTPNVLVQAASTNDEILSGGALLLAAYALLRWARSGQNFYLLIAALAAGISIGTKLHIVFYLPVLGLGLFMLALGAWRNRQAARRIWRGVGWGVLTACLAAGLLMIVPFLFYNYFSVGRWYFADEFAGDFFNTQWRGIVVFQNFLIYTLQMLFAPFTDLYGAGDQVARETLHAAVNGFFLPLVGPYLSADPADYHLQYRFKGVTLMVSPYYLEYSLWAGFSFLLAPLIWWQAARHRKRPLGHALLLLACAPVLWFATWCITTLYMEGTPTYLAYYLVISSPALALALLPMPHKTLGAMRWALVTFVLVTHAIIAFNTYRFNEFRNIPRLLTAPRLPYDWELMDQSVINEIRMARKIKPAFTRWGMSYFSIMGNNPHAFYYGPQEDVADMDDTLTIFSVPSMQFWGFAPISWPEKPNPGAVFIGKMRGWGPEGVFAVGNGVDRRWPASRNRYVIFQAVQHAAPMGAARMTVAQYSPGYIEPDVFEIRYEAWRGDVLLGERDWQTEKRWDMDIAQADGALKVKIMLRLPGAVKPGSVYTLALNDMREWTDRLAGAGSWLDKTE